MIEQKHFDALKQAMLNCSVYSPNRRHYEEIEALIRAMQEKIHAQAETISRHQEGRAQEVGDMARAHRSELEAMQAENETMRQALKPFADFIERTDPFWSDNRRIASLDYDFNKLTLGLFRKARSAIEASPPQAAAAPVVEGLSEINSVQARFERCVSTLVSSDYAAGYREALNHVRNAIEAAAAGRV